MKKTTTIYFIFGTITLFIVLLSSYTLWNMLDPKHTCVSCHEIAPSHARWKTSAHADVRCIECHGTALSAGYHSLKEKLNMVFTHYTTKVENEDIRLNETQVLQINERCIECHRDEGAKWQAGRHSTTYRDIFTDSVHNATEPPYADCFRCHGMYYDKDITALLHFPEGYDKPEIIDAKAMSRPAIPCLACHRMHTENPPQQRMKRGDAIGQLRNPVTGLYIRTEKMFMRSDALPRVQMMYQGKKLLVAEDGNTWLCIQCHAPNAHHEARTDDDRTPIGAFEGKSCLECHDPHSGQILPAALSRYGFSPKDMTGKCFALPPKEN